jgi:hypothetical protein
MKPNDLLGKKFPVKDENDNYIATRIIKKAMDWENGAGFLIAFDENSTQLLSIGFIIARDTINGKFDNLPSIEEYQNGKKK